MNIHIYKKLVLKIKKEKRSPSYKKEKNLKIAEVVKSKYNKIILFQLINTSFRIHKNKHIKKKTSQIKREIN